MRGMHRYPTCQSWTPLFGKVAGGGGGAAYWGGPEVPEEGGYGALAQASMNPTLHYEPTCVTRLGLPPGPCGIGNGQSIERKVGPNCTKTGVFNQNRPNK